MYHSFIVKLLHGTADETIHRQFVRFSKGTFPRRAMVSLKKSEKNLRINTSFEYSADLAFLTAYESQGPVTVSGTIVTSQDITKELPFPATFTKRMGVGKIEIAETSVTKEQLLSFLDHVKDHLILLNLSASNCSLLCKQTVPNPKKSPKINDAGVEEEPKIDHCKALFTNPAVADAFLFETQAYKNARIVHTYTITSIDVPAAYKHNSEQARIHAKRTGTILRVLDIDGKQTQKEYPFSA